MHSKSLRRSMRPANPVLRVIVRPCGCQDYFIEYQRRLARVTAEDVQQACKRHLHPGEQVIVVAGDARMIEGQLSEIPSIRALLPLPLTDDADEQRGVD